MFQCIDTHHFNKQLPVTVCHSSWGYKFEMSHLRICLTVRQILEDFAYSLQYCSSRVVVNYCMQSTEYGCRIIIVIKHHSSGRSFYKNTVKIWTLQQISILRSLCNYLCELCHDLYTHNLL